MTSSVGQPPKQRSKITPSGARRIERDGVLSWWAGQCPIQRPGPQGRARVAVRMASRGLDMGHLPPGQFLARRVRMRVDHQHPLDPLAPHPLRGLLIRLEAEPPLEQVLNHPAGKQQPFSQPYAVLTRDCVDCTAADAFVTD
ncbi:MAG: hypothetical protein RML14_03245 [Meiothermus sp.]|uniref:hypothetical protein n=1 Tax=Meiothermus sp. TaxID=1955249 RepID=UPI00298F0FA8|nr:hypothetical protein [Meiothermus sp.]MDW8480904.1 hypothetical protein [Meiothermus sp.]